jgi:hypothetical protein
MTSRVRQWLLDPDSIYNATSAQFPDPSTQRRLAARAAAIGTRWPKLPEARRRAVLTALIERIEVRVDQIDIHLRPMRLLALFEMDGMPLKSVTDEETLILSIPARLRRAGMEITMLDADRRDRFAAPRRALAATARGSGLDRGPRFSGDLRNLPVLRLDIGLGVQVSVNLAEFRTRYFAVGGARPILVENIEENELLGAATDGTSAHASIPGMLVDAPQTSATGGDEAKRHQSLQIAVPQRVAQGLKRCAERKR